LIGAAPLVWLALAGGPAAAPPPDPALVLEAGAVARRQIVAVGQDLVVAGDALAGVTVVDGSARISGSVSGDVTVLGGDVVLEPSAAISGHVHVLGGRLGVAPGARIEGRSVAYPTFSRAWLTLLEGPSLGLSAGSPIVLGAKLGLLAAWLGLTVLLFAVGGRPLGAVSAELRSQPMLCFLTGLVAVLAVTLAALLLSAVLPSLLALPLLVLVVLAIFLAKLWGTVAAFHALGDAILSRGGRRRPRALDAASVGFIVLGAIKFVPYAGVAIWAATTFVAVGATLRTKFGRREAWFSTHDALLAPRS